MSGPSISLAEPLLSQGNESSYVQECLRTNFISSIGPFVEKFERAFAKSVGAPYAVACASGTAAIHVALRLLEAGPGDEIWVSTLTFIASANPILYQGATPVLVDAEERTWNLDAELAAEELRRRIRTGGRLPKAIEVVHILGHPADFEALAQLCAENGVILFEDAAEVLGAKYIGGTWAGRQVGTLGRIGCYSFNGNKIITSGGGGMLVTAEESLALRAKHLTTQAKLPGLAYQHDEVGYNYRLTNLAAALGLAQLEQLPNFLERKRQIAARYHEALGSLPGVTLPPGQPWAAPSWWLYSILIDSAAFGQSRDAVLVQLISRGIQCRPIWQPLHAMPMFRSAPRLGGGVAERLAAQGLSLPCSVGLTNAEQDRVIAALHELAKV